MPPPTPSTSRGRGGSKSSRHGKASGWLCHKKNHKQEKNTTLLSISKYLGMILSISLGMAMGCTSQYHETCRKTKTGMKRGEVEGIFSMGPFLKLHYYRCIFLCLISFQFFWHPKRNHQNFASSKGISFSTSCCETGWKLGCSPIQYLEDHPRTCKWLIAMVIVSPLTGVIPLINGLFMAYK